MLAMFLLHQGHGGVNAYRMVGLPTAVYETVATEPAGVFPEYDGTITPRLSGPVCRGRGGASDAEVNIQAK